MSHEDASTAAADAAVAQAPARKTRLWRRHIIVMIVLTIVSFGFYYPIWFLRRRIALNQLDSPRKIQRWPFVLFLSVSVIGLLLAVLFPSRAGAPPGATLAPIRVVFGLARYALALVLVVQCFFVKDILEDHLAGPGDEVMRSVLARDATLSGLLTFFFTIYYLQHVINVRIIDADAVQAT
jgi:hypothetical protein